MERLRYCTLHSGAVCWIDSGGKILLFKASGSVVGFPGEYPR